MRLLLAYGKQIDQRHFWHLRLYNIVKLEELCYLLNKTGTHTARQVIEQEFLWSPHAFHNTAKHPQGKHIKKEVGKSAMQELIRQKLKQVEITCQKEMEPAEIREPWHNKSRKENQAVDYQQILGNRWHILQHNIFSLKSLSLYFCRKITKNIRQTPQNKGFQSFF
jgi:hypothetical protein